MNKKLHNLVKTVHVFRANVRSHYSSHEDTYKITAFLYKGPILQTLKSITLIFSKTNWNYVIYIVKMNDFKNPTTSSDFN
jgi:hypothetical protein